LTLPAFQKPQDTSVEENMGGPVCGDDDASTVVDWVYHVLRTSNWRATGGEISVIQKGPAGISQLASPTCAQEGPQSTHGTMRTSVGMAEMSAAMLITIVHL